MNGYNVTVLAYGQTGSGKTYTMGSNFAVGESDESVGMIPRVIMALFSLIEARREAVSVTVSASFLEIYNEQINDLLGGRENLAKIYSDEHGNIRVGELEVRGRCRGGGGGGGGGLIRNVPMRARAPAAAVGGVLGGA